MADTPDLNAIDAKMARKPIEDGGPAFPTRWPRSDDAEYWTESGLSVRAYIATHVLAAMFTRETYDAGQATPQLRARLAVLDADALIAELKA